MTPQNIIWTITGSCLFSCAIVVAITYFLLWRKEQRGERVPVSEKLLRPAGESVRLKMEQLDRKLNLAVMLTIIVPGLVSGGILLVENGAIIIAGLVAFVALQGGLTLWLFNVARAFGNYRLGFRGERAVGEELNQLLREGCHVFHDVPMDPYGNIDHVVVAPCGVFAVETKTRRKRKAPAGRKEHEIIYDGQTLDFPHCKDAHGLEQAQQQADRLRNLLSKAVGEPVPVSAILTFPGWFVTSRVNTPALKVVNPKQIKGVVMNGRNAPLNSQFLQRIVHQLDQKCRDVEF